MYQSNAHISTFLTNLSRGYKPEGYVSDALLTPVPTAQYTGKLLVAGNDHLRVVHNMAGERAEYKYIETNTYSTDSYDINDYGLQTEITEKMFRNYTLPADARRETTMKLTHAMWLAKESAVATTIQTAGNYAASNKVTLSGTDRLSDYTNSDPYDVFTDAQNAVRAACGIAPDTATMDWQTRQVLRYHPKILENSKYVKDATGGISDDSLAMAMGVKRVLVADVTYNSAKQGQTDVLAPLWGKHIVFSVSPTSPAIMQKGFAYDVHLDNKPRKQVRTMKRADRPENELLFIDDNYDLLMDFTAGYLVTNAIA